MNNKKRLIVCLGSAVCLTLTGCSGNSMFKGGEKSGKMGCGGIRGCGICGGGG